MKNHIGLIHDAEELRKLIQENPELPIVILANEEANSGEWCWQYCNSVSCCIDTILDVATPYDSDGEKVFTDETDFLEEIEESLYDEFGDSMTTEQIEEAAKREADMYSGCWRKVIAIYVGN